MSGPMSVRGSRERMASMGEWSGFGGRGLMRVLCLDMVSGVG